ncbi:MAG: biosynthetic-type acetolactate synthase large subunit [Anaerobiospirillum succiniciproducens]|uniref:biosynthetic-type acetolactate synthase large subunit n=1 Tax=Anaerobiospirillum succiniciproducens TaxID=13335 RepID=UPI0026DB59D8|nr:biosynthetic-type acetolactate synthase large subunit [Anaerobiospirillum succiniciproducens]MDO4675997.1 biosynthetic-type acetolactate synthase large subunit [Anaerobiospirillum succiniciproducens]
MTKMSGAQQLVRTLEDLGVEYLFGYPGGAVIDIYDALQHSESIKHVLARHEQGACHMADGYARTTGKVGCALVTSGPGATNAVTAIATAYADSVPMVVLTGQVATSLIGTDAFQEVDTMGITRPVVKHSFLCKTPHDIPKYIRQAFYIASTGKPGPVVVDIPKDCVGFASAGTDFQPIHEEDLKLVTYNPTSQGHKGQIRRAIKQLMRANRPIVLAGGGAIVGNACENLNKFVKRFNLPVVSTLLGLGAVPASSENFLGMLGMHGTYQANSAIAKSDLIFCVGARFDDRITNNTKKFCPNAKIIHIDIDPSAISKIIEADLPIVGDAATILGQILDMSDEMGVKQEEAQLQTWWEYINKLKEVDGLKYHKEEGICHPAEVVETIYKACKGKNVIISTDVGQHQMFTALYYKFEKPRTFITSGGLGTMGFGFPAAIGAWFGNQDTEVVLITGDGSFQMNIQELSTCLEYNVPVKVFILDNHTLGMVRQWQTLFYQGRITSTNLNHNPDFVKVAEAYGHSGFVVGKPEELEETVNKALAMKDKLVVVDVMCNTCSQVLPMQKTAGAMDEMLLPSDEANQA